jgi:ATP-binding cassette, subfamily B, bacterial PglK
VQLLNFVPQFYSKSKATTLGRSLSIFPHEDRRKLGYVAVIQVFLGIIDLIGVAVIGILGALAVNGIQSKTPGNRVSQVLNFLMIQGLQFQTQVAILGAIAVAVLIFRTLLSVFFTRKILFYLSRISARISARMISRLLTMDILEIQKRTTQETMYAVINGVNTISLGIVGNSITIIADLSILVFLSLGLFYIDPLISFAAVGIFAFVAFILYLLMHKRAEKLGKEYSHIAIRSNEKILEVLSAYREAIVGNRREFYAQEIGNDRLLLANNAAESSFMPNISKYVIELSLIVGSFFVAAIQFLLQDSIHAISTLTVFLAAGSRLAPAVLRMQQGAIQIRNSLGTARPTLDLVEGLNGLQYSQEQISDLDTVHDGFQPNVNIKNLTLVYDGGLRPALEDINFKIDKGSIVAFVGASGAGKTSLADCLLGVIIPNSGHVTISGMTPVEAIRRWPGSIAYVPQEILIIKGSVRENVSMGYPTDSSHDSLVWSALQTAGLIDFVNLLPNGLDSQVGERGTSLSGGQRQRLGIARALFTKPSLIVFDESTSALDAVTEQNITDAVLALRGQTTVIIIAHRLSTVKKADKLLYLENGKLIAEGTFTEIKNQVPEFKKQAELMGF